MRGITKGTTGYVAKTVHQGVALPTVNQVTSPGVTWARRAEWAGRAEWARWAKWAGRAGWARQAEWVRRVKVVRRHLVAKFGTK